MCGNRGYSIHGQYASCIFNTCFVVELHPGQPSWITNRFKKKQNFFRTPRGTFVIILVTWHTVVLKKKLKMWKVTNMRINGWIPDTFNSQKLSLWLWWARKWPYKRGGIWWEWPYKRVTTVLACVIRKTYIPHHYRNPL